MATALYENSASISSTEYSLTNNSTTLTAKTEDGPLQVWLDLNAVALGDSYLLRVYEKVQSGGTQRLVDSWILGPQAKPVWVSPALIMMHGWEVSLQKLAGTDRTIPWSIRQA
jgi:hypothetical protein